MRLLEGREAEDAERFMEEAAKVALPALCERARCGTVIVKEGKIIGQGFNSPPAESTKRCSCKKDSYHHKVTDKTCCIHAEQRAIMDAIRNNPDKIKGSQLFFTRVDENGTIKRSGQPYCTICSKMALDSGISEFLLWQEKGICAFDTEEYNDLSFKFGQE